MSRIFKGSGERKSLWDRMVDVALTDVTVLARGGVDAGSLEELEELLLGADFGVPATLRLVDRIERMAQRGEARSQDDFRTAVRDEILGILRAGNADTALRFNFDDGPTVVLVMGVNGAGKTTSIGKLAHRLSRQGRRVMIVAGDTFRAGAIDQLRRWSERAGCAFAGADAGRDPAAVAFDALDAARTQTIDVVLIDTAGRLHTQRDLMGELTKVHRVIARKEADAPHETLIVLDATIGQNAVAQVNRFREAAPISGIVLSKFDSTARGGIVVALKEEFDLPVKFLGVGEAIDDLEPFDPEAYADAVLAS